LFAGLIFKNRGGSKAPCVKFNIQVVHCLMAFAQRQRVKHGEQRNRSGHRRQDGRNSFFGAANISQPRRTSWSRWPAYGNLKAAPPTKPAKPFADTKKPTATNNTG
jgi:hypothetical protein